MRFRAFLTGTFVTVALAAGLVAPAQAAPAVFKGTLAFPAPITDGLSGEEYGEIVCPDAGPANGTFYAFVDLKADYKVIKMEGPTRLVTDPSGTTQSGDYDLDMFLFDAKCQPLDNPNTSSGTERFDGKKLARYVVVHYYVGIHPNLPFTVQAANERIK